MSEENELREKAREMFVVSQGDALSDILEEMEGWFYISGGDIRLDNAIHSLDKGPQYVAYLLAAYVAEFIEERETRFVEHGEAHEYFGWTSGRCAGQYAADYSSLLNTEDGAKAVAPAKLKVAVDKVAEKLESD